MDTGRIIWKGSHIILGEKNNLKEKKQYQQPTLPIRSALYVVDLKRFRQLAAGDRLRGQYQMLSADPNSLANLDQDLPNNMIHQIPIFSLPQEWYGSDD
jgi:hypothetical protein